MASTYIHFTDEQKERANSVDLEHFLMSKGERLERSGRDKRLKSDHSITVRGNSWYDHSKEQGGYAIDFVKMFYNLDFPSAVTELIGETGCELNRRTYEKKEEPPKPFALPPKNDTMKRVFAYLTKQRCIEPSVLSFFARHKLLYESREISEMTGKEYHNAVFVGMDIDGNPAHAHKRSIYSEGKRFMQNVEGSKPQHSFHYLGGSNRLYVFEAPIDMLSFISMYNHSDWQSHNYVALCGTSSQPMLTLLENHAHLNHVVLCVDNDKAGHEIEKRFRELLSGRAMTISRVTPQGKDFNEDLVARQTEQVQQTQASEPELKMG